MTAFNQVRQGKASARPFAIGTDGMLLAWSATLAKLNKTFLSAKGRIASRGGSSIFSIYRYKIAKEPVELPAWETFEERAHNIIAAKREIDNTIKLKRTTGGWYGSAALLGKRKHSPRSTFFTVHREAPVMAHLPSTSLFVLEIHEPIAHPMLR